MGEHLTTKWTCNRCGVEEIIEGNNQPQLFVRVFFSTPPRNATKTAIGELCNPCGGYLVDFMANKEMESIERDRVIADIEQRLAADDKTDDDDITELWGGA